MSPRSSRSHSTQAPAESTMPSTPQVTWPSRLATTTGKHPEENRFMSLGPAGPRTRSSIAPVPKVILTPSRTHDWPKSDAGWSPTSAVIRGAPASAVARPCSPIVSTMSARSDGAIPRCASVSASQRRASTFDEAGDRGVGVVGDVDRALGEDTRDPGLDGGHAQVARPGRPRARGASAAWSPTGSARAAAPRPAGRGSRSRCAGPASPGRVRPVRRSSRRRGSSSRVGW